MPIIADDEIRFLNSIYNQREFCNEIFILILIFSVRLTTRVLGRLVRLNAVFTLFTMFKRRLSFVCFGAVFTVTKNKQTNKQTKSLNVFVYDARLAARR